VELLGSKATRSRARVAGGWLHTGDCFRSDGKGFLYFAGRSTDSLRRRGENVSAYDIESAVLEFPDVQECAAYPIPSSLSEDDIMIAVVPIPGHGIGPHDLREFLHHRLPRFALPRYVRIISSLPKTTATARVRKGELVAAGVTTDTVDFEATSPSRSAVS
jgi:crotonobetaine/carnitine-CoA ligase